MRSLAKLIEGKEYADQLKPFNFLLTCHVKPFGHPPGIDPERFHLIAPYERDPSRWLEMPWIDQHGKAIPNCSRGLPRKSTGNASEDVW
jgi:hypothetical protein